MCVAVVTVSRQNSGSDRRTLCVVTVDDCSYINMSGCHRSRSTVRVTIMGVECNACLVAAAVTAVCWVTVSGQVPDVQKMFITCQQQSNATDEELAAFQRSQTIPTTEHGRCLLACIFEKTGVLTKDGKYDADGVYELAKMSYMKAPEKLEKAKKVVETCSKEVEQLQNRCEIAVRVANCTMLNSVKFGLDGL